MPLGPGDVVDGRYELVRPLGGGDLGRVFVAYDRPLDRRVALRLVEPGDAGGRPGAGGGHPPHERGPVQLAHRGARAGPGPDTRWHALRGDGAGGRPRPGPGGDAPRARCPPDEAVRYGVELLDACLAAGRQEEGRSSIVPATALVTTDGHIRVARFADAPAPGPAGRRAGLRGRGDHRAPAADRPRARPRRPGPRAAGGARGRARRRARGAHPHRGRPAGPAARGAARPRRSPAVPEDGRAPAEHTWLLWIASLGLVAVLIVLVVLGVMILVD